MWHVQFVTFFFNFGTELRIFASFLKLMITLTYTFPDGYGPRYNNNTLCVPRQRHSLLLHACAAAPSVRVAAPRRFTCIAHRHHRQTQGESWGNEPGRRWAHAEKPDHAIALFEQFSNRGDVRMTMTAARYIMLCEEDYYKG